jgi:hypothetical protein
MSAVEAKRTLVKSPPEVWAKVSDPAALADHLADLGPIEITRMEPETVVLWEGDRASGSVRLESGGWGTKVTLTAELEEEPEPAAVPEPEAEPEAVAPEPEPAPEPVAEVAPEPEPAPKRGFFARWFGRRKAAAAPAPVIAAAEPVAPEPEPEPVAAEPAPDPAPEPEPVAEAPTPPEPEPLPEPEPGEHPPPHHDPQHALAVLEAALDRLGAAHHRPFSRA